MANGFRCARFWTVSTRLGHQRTVRCLCQETNHHGEEIDDLPARDSKIVRECNRRGGYKMPLEERAALKAQEKEERGHHSSDAVHALVLVGGGAVLVDIGS